MSMLNNMTILWALSFSVNKNSNDEVTSLIVKKGKTNELINRHVECIIPLLKKDCSSEGITISPPVQNAEVSDQPLNGRPSRLTAIAARQKCKQMLA